MELHFNLARWAEGNFSVYFVNKARSMVVWCGVFSSFTLKRYVTEGVLLGLATAPPWSPRSERIVRWLPVTSTSMRHATKTTVIDGVLMEDTVCIWDQDHIGSLVAFLFSMGRTWSKLSERLLFSLIHEFTLQAIISPIHGFKKPLCACNNWPLCISDLLAEICPLRMDFVFLLLAQMVERIKVLGIRGCTS